MPVPPRWDGDGEGGKENLAGLGVQAFDLMIALVASLFQHLLSVETPVHLIFFPMDDLFVLVGNVIM